MYDFDTLVDRNGTGACKWDRRTAAEKAQGIIPLSIADMEFPVAPCVKEAVVRAAERGIYGYTDPEERYFGAVMGWMEKRHGMKVRREEIVCLYGVVPALHAAVRAYTEPGDKVILQTPVYYPFSEAVTLTGREIAENPLKEVNGRYEMDFEGLEKLAGDPRTKLLLLCSPHNPVGRVWREEELMRLHEICWENGVVVVSDEIHFDLVLHGRHTPALCVSEKAKMNSILCTAPSKTFNVPGLQLANMIIPNETLRARFRKQIASDGYSNISHFGYAATIAAYEGGDQWLDALLDYLRGNERVMRGFLEEHFPEAVFSPMEGTYLAWVNFRCLKKDPAALERFMRGAAGLFLDEGRIFGPAGEGYERFNIALPRAELKKALTRLYEAALHEGLIAGKPLTWAE